MTNTEVFANSFITSLAAGCAAGDTTITVQSAPPAALQSAGTQFRILVDGEYMIVQGTSSTTWSVTRGAEGSTAVSHASGAAVTHILTAGALGPSGLMQSVVSDASSIDLCRGPYSAAPGQDITTALQSAINAINSSNKDGTIYFSQPGVYNISGALQAGNSGTSPTAAYCGQVLYPARAAGSGAISITIKGPTPSPGPMVVSGLEPIATGGVILQSTLATPAASSTLSAGLSTAAAVTSLPINSLTLPAGMTKIQAGQNVYVSSGSNIQVFTLTADAVAGATSLTVLSDTPNFAFPSAATVQFPGWIFDSIAATYAGSGTPFTDIRAHFQDITVRAPLNPVVGGINGLNLATLRFAGAVSIDTPMTAGHTPPTPTGAGMGVQFPPFDRYAMNRQEGTLQVVGYPVGIAFSEHTHLDDVVLEYGVVGLQPQGLGGSGHTSLIGRALVQGIQYPIRPAADAVRPITCKIELLDIGDSADSSIGYDAVVNDPINLLFGQITVGTEGVSTPRGFKVYGARSVTFLPYLNPRALTAWPSDGFHRGVGDSANQNYIGVTDQTHHVWVPFSTMKQSSFSVGAGSLKELTGAEAWITYMAGRPSPSRVIRTVLTTGSGSYNAYQAFGAVYSGAKINNRLLVQLNGGTVRLVQAAPGNTTLASSAAGAVAASTTYTVDTVISNPVGGPYSITVFLNGVPVALSLVSGTGTIVGNSYQLSATEIANLADTTQIYTQDGLGLFDTGTAVTYFAVGPN